MPHAVECTRRAVHRSVLQSTRQHSCCREVRDDNARVQVRGKEAHPQHRQTQPRQQQPQQLLQQQRQQQVLVRVMVVPFVDVGDADE